MGLLFDGTLPTLLWDYQFEKELGRSINVDALGILECLEKIYQSEALVKEIKDAR